MALVAISSLPQLTAFFFFFDKCNNYSNNDIISYSAW
jgi:hypothetical protein